MRCHYCDREATFTAETGGLRVGLCDRHLRQRFHELTETEPFASLRKRIDLERS